MTTPAEATHRLEDIEVVEVSPVKRAANKWRHLIVKDDQGASSETIAKATGAARMPAAAKQAALDSISAAMDMLMGVSQTVRGAQEDEAAPVPPDVLEGLKQASQVVQALSAQLVPRPPPQPGVPPPGQAAPPAQPPPPPQPPQAPPYPAAKEDVMPVADGAEKGAAEKDAAAVAADKDAAEKAAAQKAVCPKCATANAPGATACAKCGAALPAALPAAPPPAGAGAPLRGPAAMGKDAPAEKDAGVEKAGRKIAAHRMEKLKKVRAGVSEIGQEIDELIIDLQDLKEQADGLEKQVEKADGEETAETTTETTTEVTATLDVTVEPEAIATAVAKAVEGLAEKIVASMGAQVEPIRKELEAVKGRVEAAEKGVPARKSAGTNEGARPSRSEPEWPSDMSAKFTS